MFEIFEVVALLIIASLIVWVLTLYGVLTARIPLREKGKFLGFVAGVFLVGYYLPKFLDFLGIFPFKWLVLANLFLSFVYIWGLLKIRAEVQRREKLHAGKSEEKEKVEKK
ncbi:hypothetical protein KKD52_07520 [Myxococcota bacterium]|nr:hypothetical protein [Myxococcota bacterium]MBU1412220.1 hypothetical protein [Myxococcota bacterium]MBU1510196.1 hypothetical protein [Myxococcota bacterium]